jgi:hypothetical protein
MSMDIAALSDEASLWEMVGYFSAAVVTIGVAGESVTELTNWIKPGWVRRYVERASVLILLLGLTFEILAQVQANSKNSLIIELLEQQTERLKSDNLALAAKIAPRELSGSEIAALKSALKPFAHPQISIWSYGMDAEAGRLANQILAALQDADVPAVNSIGHMISSWDSGVRIGVVITGADETLVSALVTALGPISAKRGLKLSPDQAATAVAAEIFVGLKPIKP